MTELDDFSPMGRTVLLNMAREAIASTALFHDATCDCDVCRATDGDPEAMARVLAIMFDADGGP